VTLKFVPFPVCLPGDKELVWLLAKRENLTPEAALQDSGAGQVIADRPEAMKAQFKARLFLGRSDARA
jgi:hypothetical protein